MLFKKKKNPNSDFLTNTPAPQPQPVAPQPAPQPSNTQSASDNELTLAKLLAVVDRMEDPEIKSKTYMLIGHYYYQGTNGASKDEDKAIQYLQLSIDTDSKNAEALFELGTICYLRGMKTNNTKEMAKGLTNLILAYQNGNKAAYETLGTIAKSNLFPEVNTADELITYLLRK